MASRSKDIIVGNTVGTQHSRSEGDLKSYLGRHTNHKGELDVSFYDYGVSSIPVLFVLMLMLDICMRK